MQSILRCSSSVFSILFAVSRQRSFFIFITLVDNAEVVYRTEEYTFESCRALVHFWMPRVEVIRGWRGIITRNHARLHPGVRLLQKTFHNAIKFIMLLFTFRDELGCPSGLRGQTQVFFSGLRRNIVRKSVLVVTDCVGSNPTLSTVFLLPWGTYMYDCSLPLCRSITHPEPWTIKFSEISKHRASALPPVTTVFKSIILWTSWLAPDHVACVHVMDVYGALQLSLRALFGNISRWLHSAEWLHSVPLILAPVSFRVAWRSASLLTQPSYLRCVRVRVVRACVNMLYFLPLSDLSMKLGYPRAKYIYNVSAGLVHNFMEGATKAGCKTLAEPTDWLVKHCATFLSQQRFHCISYKALGD